MGVAKSKYVPQYVVNKTQENHTVLNVFFDYLQFPLGGIINLENFSGNSQKSVTTAEFPSQITCSDFNPRGQIILLGFSNGSIKVLDSAHFQTICEVPGSDFVVCVNCKVAGTVYAGLNNGTVKEYRLSSEGLLEQSTYIAKTTVFGIEVTEKELFVGYNDGNNSSGIYRYNKLQPTKPETVIEFTDIRYKTFKVLDKNQLLITLEESGKSFTFFSCISGVQLLSISNSSPAVDFIVLSHTKQLRSVYIGDVELSSLDDDESSLDGAGGAILYVSTNEGTILTALVNSFMSGTKQICRFTTKAEYNIKAEFGLKENAKVTAEYIDPVTDKLVLGTEGGSIFILGDTIKKAIVPSQKQS